MKFYTPHVLCILPRLFDALRMSEANQAKEARPKGDPANGPVAYSPGLFWKQRETDGFLVADRSSAVVSLEWVWTGML